MKMMPYKSSERGAASPRITVVGIGESGVHAIRYLTEHDQEGVDTYLAVAPISSAIVPNASVLHFRTDSDYGPEAVRKFYTQHWAELVGPLTKADIVFFLTNLDQAGSAVLVEMARSARDGGALTVVVAAQPAFDATELPHRPVYPDVSAAADTIVLAPIGINQLNWTVRDTYPDAITEIAAALSAPVNAIADLIRLTGEVNVDFSDVRSVMSNRGPGVVSSGVGRGESRAMEAAQEAISSPLLDNLSIQGAKGVLINITGGADLALDEVTTISSIIQEAAGDHAEIIFGAVHDSDMQGSLKVTLVAVGVPFRQESSGGPAATSAMSPEPAVVVAWDPDFVDADTYAEVIEIIAELARLEGANGITRIRSEGLGVPAADEVFV